MADLRSTEDVSTSSDTASLLNKLPAEIRNRIHSLVYHRINHLPAPSISPTDANILDRAHESNHAHDDDTSPLAPKTPTEQCDGRTSHGWSLDRRRQMPKRGVWLSDNRQHFPYASRDLCGCL
ncbi:hypothetical protein Q7P36_006853 [Cladosporium allicinum]